MNVTMDSAFAAICGITERELTTTLRQDIEYLAELNEMTYDEMHQALKLKYDGYHFTKNSEEVYNPFSLIKAFQQRELSNWWFESGTPSFLIRQLKHFETDITSLDRLEVPASAFDQPTENMVDALPLLYQSGYLTIKDYDKVSGIYTLGFPNLEVKHGFLSFLLNYYTSARGSGNLLIRQMNNDLMTGRPKDFLKRMEAFFAKQNYQIQGDAEKDFQYAMSIILQLLSDSLTISTEGTTSEGRIDILAEAPRFVYIIEIKINDSAEAALRQIEEKAYARQFADDPRKLFKIGVRFSTADRCIDDWTVDPSA
jgi:hypothetical protein